MTVIRRAILALAMIATIAPAMAQAPPPVPGLPDAERRTSYSLSASTCSCSVGFQIYGDGTDYQNWVEVYINGVPATYNDSNYGWTITSPTGTLALIPRPITDAVLTFNNPQTGTIQIVGARRPRRTSQFSENAGVPARNVNQVVTDITATLREMWDRSNDLTGRIVRAPPGETMASLPPAASRASMGACFDNSGNLTPCIGVPSGSFAPGNGVTFTGTNPTTISTPTFAAGSGVAFTGSNPTIISAGSSSNGALLVPSRTAATSLDLHTYGAIKTGGYATPADGGGATFQNVGSTPFLDGNVCGYTLAGGSGYTNGTYKIVTFSGGTGQAFYANVTISGGVVTAVNHVFNAGGFGYSSGDVLTTGAGNIGGTGSGMSITVNCITVIRASFTDSVGTHFQYISENYIDPRQFGVKMDWLGVDASATDNAAALQAAFNFSSYSVTALVSGGGGNSAGTKVLMPKGVAMVCSLLQMWNSTQLQGQGLVNSGIHLCDTLAGGTGNFITVGDSFAQLACFGNRISDINISQNSVASSTSNTYMLFSNCVQQGEVLNNVAIYTGKRGGIDFEIGYGGAATFYTKGVFITLSPNAASEGIKINYGTTLIHLVDTIIEASSLTGTGINALGGVITLDNFHSEGISSPLIVNMATANHSLTLFNSSGGTVCVNFVTLNSTNTVGNFALFNSQKNGCSGNLVSDNQPSGVSRATDAKPSAGWVGFNP
jgi:hypothetical protein